MDYDLDEVIWCHSVTSYSLKFKKRVEKVEKIDGKYGPEMSTDTLYITRRYI